jgi:hypothetical protein
MMGTRRSGKSSIQKVVFHKMSPHETLFIESTNQVVCMHVCVHVCMHETLFIESTNQVVRMHVCMHVCMYELY